MASNSRNSNQLVNPSARTAMDNMKFEVANAQGVTLKQGYNGNITSREAGTIGGYMVKRMIESVEQGMSNK